MSGKRAKQPSEASRMRQLLRRELDGYSYTPQRTPRVTVQAPWNHLTVTQTVATANQTPFALRFSVSEIWKTANQQLGVGNVVMAAELRFEKVEVWLESDDSNASIALAPYFLSEFTSSSTKEFRRLEDHCGKNQFAAIGFVWPKAQQQAVFESTDDFPVFRVGSKKGASAVYVRVHLLWRGSLLMAPGVELVDYHAPERSPSPFQEL